MQPILSFHSKEKVMQAALSMIQYKDKQLHGQLEFNTLLSLGIFNFIMLNNSRRFFFVFLVTGSLLAGCGPTTVDQLEKKSAAKQFAPENILQLVEGNTMLFVSFNEDSYFYFDSSGRVYGMDINDNKDIGKWDVTNTGELCMRLQHWWYGDLKCFSVYAEGNKYALANNAGVIAFNARHFPGDHKNQYYEPKQPKKSYRRSIRTKDAPQHPDAVQQQPGERAQTVDKQKSQEQEQSYTTSDAELKSTVKWMAKDCPGCNLARSNLKKADLIGAKLAGANLSGANLSMADMRRADLRDANLERADLTYANMPGANLRNCNLRKANLKGANLIRADLTGADLEGAILDDALLEGTIGIK